MFNLKRFFFPHDKFSQAVLVSLNDSGGRLTSSDVYSEMSYSTSFKDPSIARIMLTLKRLESKGLVWANKPHPQSERYLYGITQKGKEAIEK